MRGGEIAGFALGNFLAGHVGGYFAEAGGRLGEIIGGQPGGDFGVFLRGGDDEVAIVGDDGNRAVRFMVHVFICCWSWRRRRRHVAGVARFEQIGGRTPAQIGVVPAQSRIPIGGFHARFGGYD